MFTRRNRDSSRLTRKERKQYRQLARAFQDYGDSLTQKDTNVASKQEGGITLFGMAFITFLVFLVLKLLNKVEWSWWAVTAPLWVYVLLLVAGLLIIILWGLVLITVKLLFGRRK